MKTRLFALLAFVLGSFTFTACEQHDFEDQEVKNGDKPHPGPGGKIQVIPGTNSLFKGHGGGDAEHGEKKADH